MPKKRVNITIDSDLHDRLQHESPNVSQLLENLASDYLEKIEHACLHVKNADLTEAELICIADSLNGLALIPDMPTGEQLAANMEDYAWLQDSVQERGIGEERWKEVCEKVRSDEPLAEHLWTWKTAYYHGIRTARRLTGEVTAAG